MVTAAPGEVSATRSRRPRGPSAPASRGMALDYRIYTLDVDDCATSLQALRADDDAAALKAAEDMAADHYAVEVWREDGPLVARLGGDVAPSEGEADFED